MNDSNNLNSQYILKQLAIDGVFELITKKNIDSRGYFLNCFREEEEWFKRIWSPRKVKQINVSFTKKIGTIRGLHYQIEPFEECKLVHCLNGRIWDVAVDLRKESPTYLKWISLELSPDFNNAIIIPEGFAHGFQTLEKDSELLYIHTNHWKSNYERGIKWNDQNLKINWPIKSSEISVRDQKLPYLNI